MSRELHVETLRLLLRVDESGSIGEAARSLGISQPAASARLREFEARWRLHLFDRSARGTVLTEDGQTVAFWARRVLEEVDRMRAGVRSLSSHHRHDLAVAASFTIAECLLPHWVGEVLRLHPLTHPRLTVVNSDEVTSLVRRSSVDVGFIESHARPEDLACTNIGSDHLVIVVRPDHPWADTREPISTAELRSTAFVVREPGSGTRATFERALGSSPRVAMEVSSTTTLIGGVYAGAGPGVVSGRAVGRDLEAGRLRRAPHTLNLARPLTAVWNPRRGLPDLAAGLVRVGVCP